MALSSAKFSISRAKSPSCSPLSPTIIHYHQKYQIEKVSKDYHRQIRRHHPQKQQIRNSSRQQQQQHQNRRIKKIGIRRQSPSLWEIHQSSNGRMYYYNVITDQSQWEKPPRAQLSSWIAKKSKFSKQTSNNNNDLLANNQFHSKNSKRSRSNSIFISENNFDSIRSQSSDIHQRSINNNNQIKIITTNHHHKRRKENIKIKSSFKKLRKDRTKSDEVVLSTPTSPPEYEKIQIDFVDPIPTPSTSIINKCIPFIDPQQQSSSISFNEKKFKSIHSKQSIKSEINEELSSRILQSSLCPSESTINAILQLEHSFTITNSNSDHRRRYYRAQFIEHLLNCPLTPIERLSNEQIRFATCQLISLRTDLFSLRLKLERNDFYLVKYRYSLINQEDLLDKLQLID